MIHSPEKNRVRSRRKVTRPNAIRNNIMKRKRLKYEEEYETIESIHKWCEMHGFDYNYVLRNMDVFRLFLKLPHPAYTMQEDTSKSIDSLPRSQTCDSSANLTLWSPLVGVIADDENKIEHKLPEMVHEIKSRPGWKRKEHSTSKRSYKNN